MNVGELDVDALTEAKFFVIKSYTEEDIHKVLNEHYVILLVNEV